MAVSKKQAYRGNPPQPVTPNYGRSFARSTSDRQESPHFEKCGLSGERGLAGEVAAGELGAARKSQLCSSFVDLDGGGAPRRDRPRLLRRDVDRYERLVLGTPWVASCTVTVDASDVEVCSGPEGAEHLIHAAFGEAGMREFFTHVRFHKHEDEQIVVHLLVELYAQSGEEATRVLEGAASGELAITSLAEESRPPAAGSGQSPH